MIVPVLKFFLIFMFLLQKNFFLYHIYGNLLISEWVGTRFFEFFIRNDLAICPSEMKKTIASLLMLLTKVKVCKTFHFPN